MLAALDLSVTSLANGNMYRNPLELYDPLWWYSGGIATTLGYNTTSAGWTFVQKGSTSVTTTMASGVLFTSTLSSTTKCALEIALESYTGSTTAYVALWDITANAIVGGSTISTSVIVPMVFRSSTFTLVNGHEYGLTLWSSSGSSGTYITDASLIIFPASPSQGASITRFSLQSGNRLKEAYIPLWVYSSSYDDAGAGGIAGGVVVQKGTTNVNTPSGSTATIMHTLNSNWPSSQKFAFEASFNLSSSGGTAYLCLYDITAGAVIGASQISTTSTTATLIRSGSFTLTPGHEYAVSLWTNSSAYSCRPNKAHLVALAPY